MKKVLFLLDNGLDILGGSPKSTATIGNILIKNGYDIKIWCPEYKMNLTQFPNENTVLYKKYSNRFLYLIFRLMSLKKTIKQFSPSIIHAQDAQCAILVAFLKKYRMINKSIEIYYTDRKLFSSYKKSSQKTFIRYQNHFTKIVCTTNANKRNWENLTKIKNIICINNVLDKDWYSYDESLRISEREKLGISNKYNIAFCARFEEYKRWDTVFEICKILSVYDKFVFSFAIVTPNIKDALFLNYINTLKELLGDKCFIYVNIKEQEEIKKFYYMSDFFVMTSENESFGRTILEAMSKKVIVFGTKSGGVPDVIKDENFLFEVNDFKDVSKRIIDLSNDDELFLKTKNYQNEFFKREYSLDSFSLKTLKLYKSEAQK